MGFNNSKDCIKSFEEYVNLTWKITKFQTRMDLNGNVGEKNLVPFFVNNKSIMKLTITYIKGLYL